MMKYILQIDIHKNFSMGNWNRTLTQKMQTGKKCTRIIVTEKAKEI